MRSQQPVCKIIFCRAFGMRGRPAKQMAAAAEPKFTSPKTSSGGSTAEAHPTGPKLLLPLHPHGCSFASTALLAGTRRPGIDPTRGSSQAKSTACEHVGETNMIHSMSQHARPAVSSHLAERARGSSVLHQKVAKNVVFEMLSIWRSAPKISGHILLPTPPL